MSVALGVLRLQALVESTEMLHGSLELDQLLRHLLRSVMGRLVIGRAVVAVESEGSLVVAESRGARSLPAGTTFDETTARAAGLDLMFPIGDGEYPVGLLAVGHPPAGRLDDEEQEFLRALLGIAASGIANARAHDEARRLNRRLDQKVHELETMLEFTRTVASAFEPEEIVRMLGLTLSGIWAVSRFASAAWRKGHPPVARHKGLALPAIEVLVEGLAGVDEPVRIGDLPSGELRDALARQQTEVVLPLRSGRELLGVVALGGRGGGAAYGPPELEFGAGLVAQAVMALENAWMVGETLERQRIEKELSLAASIQQGLFPAEMPKLGGIEIAARNRPARQVGGDYYDVIRVNGPDGTRRLLACVADVSGKGLPAALLMSTVQATLRALVGRVTGPGELLAAANDLLQATSPGNRFVTAVLVNVDPSTGAVTYSSAGHNDIVLVKADRSVELLPSTGLVLGLFPGATCEERTITLAPGDLLACYSDGVSEALDGAGNEYSLERLIEAIRQHSREPAQVIVDRVIESVDRFAAGAPQYDDITMMVIRRS